MLIERLLGGPVRAALADTPVVLLTGARQVGKTTLARDLLGVDAVYRTLDDAVTLAAARHDPDGFIAGAGPMVIDEVQRAPGLLLAIKAAVDRDRAPGQFILTGSSDVMTLPAIADTLAGRVEVHRLRPLSLAELTGEQVAVIDRLDEAFVDASSVSREQLVDQLLRGGYPVARERGVDRRSSWLRDYLSLVVQREVASVADVQYLEHLPRLLRLLAVAAPGPLNVTGLTTSLGAPRTTVDRYVTILRQVFLFDLLSAWHANVATRQVKAPRVVFDDSALHAHLLDLDHGRLLDWQPDKVGPLLETFVGHELQAQAGWARTRSSVHWWRTGRGEEVDFVVELAGGAVYGIEVKAAARVDPSDLRGLTRLRSAMGDRFRRGIVLYPGSQAIAFGDDLHAVPLSWLWGGAALP
jgi:uncharacterized protein